MSRNANSAARDYRRSSIAFYAFAVLIAINVGLLGTFNPDRGKPEFWINVALVLGGLLASSLWIAARLWKGKGVVAAYSLLGILTTLVGIGALFQMAGVFPETTPFPGMRVLAAARIASGFFVLLVWVVLIWDTVRTPAPPATSPADSPGT